MASLPITVKLTVCAKGNAENEWGKRRQRVRGDQEIGGGKCEETTFNLLGFFDILMLLYRKAFTTLLLC